ncbi:MAG TPA: carboxypeptidase-like regulatory domain-containing protein, partial [Terriglobia bacterium]|nr:carboxypeptidase-like regulatory domain-containing protein [Terriglobia bacterium]
ISTVFTDARGQASFKNLPYGLFELQLEHKGYALPTASSIWAVLRAEEPAHKHDVYLNRVAAISGRVLDEDGNPIVDATVTAWSVSHRLGLRMLSPASVQSRAFTGPWAARTNDRGEYRTPLYGDGEYYLRVDISDPLETRQTGSLTRSVFYPGVMQTPKRANSHYSA